MKRSFQSYVTDAAYKCDNPKCGRYSVVSWYTDYDPSDHYRSGEPEEYDRTVIWSPPPIKRPEYPDVPDHIAKAASEAWVCFAHSSYIAACAVARSVIEAAAKSFGITVRGIEAKIVALNEKNLIWGDLVASAHLVRQFGNDAAHGDIVEPVTVGEAEDVLDIMDALLHQLFSTPARALRLEASRQQRRDQTG
ncbi:DUF4145 domain-containing protein [Terrabacter aeriphilus]|uniref:DUF4145 domain-containing protein n=1 Tax=Terrabacter aeriphilus TaxID=515662 RepID=UPI0031E8B4EC